MLCDCFGKTLEAFLELRMHWFFITLKKFKLHCLITCLHLITGFNFLLLFRLSTTLLFLWGPFQSIKMTYQFSSNHDVRRPEKQPAFGGEGGCAGAASHGLPW